VIAGRELYVYWKTTAPDVATATVRALHDALRAAEPSLETHLLQRESDATAAATLMEIYRRPGGIDATLQARIERTLADATRGLVQGERHLEVFVRS
jgi:hypothetical protein